VVGPGPSCGASWPMTFRIDHQEIVAPRRAKKARTAAAIAASMAPIEKISAIIAVVWARRATSTETYTVSSLVSVLVGPVSAAPFSTAWSCFSFGSMYS
jgi:hypothetical protein